jgi:hypothetical protein
MVASGVPLQDIGSDTIGPMQWPALVLPIASVACRRLLPRQERSRPAA